MADPTPPETPTKRRKVDAVAASVSNLASSSKITLESLEHEEEEEEEEITTLPKSKSPRKRQTTAPAEGSTPRRSQRQVARPNYIPSAAKRQQAPAPASDAMDVDDEPDEPSSSSDEDDQPPPPRRFRPVYRDHKQWYSRDKTVINLWKAAEAYKQKMVELHGHPFEHLRPREPSVDV